MSGTGPDTVRIASIGIATPPFSVDQKEARAFFEQHYSGRLSHRSMKMLKKTLSHPGILKRSFALEDPGCLVDEDPDSRIKRFTQWAVALAAQAVKGALSGAGASVGDVSGLVVNTCTGYLCPGISTYLIERLGLARNLRAYDLLGSGCGGAVPNLQVAEALLRSNDRSGIVVSVSVEICSATFQMGDDLSLIVSNTIFSDGAAAAVLTRGGKGPSMIASANRYVPEQRDAIRYVTRGGQLYNQLSSDLPDLVKDSAAAVVSGLLMEHSLTVSDIQHWALHSGGVKIINAVQEELGLSAEQTRPTRTILEQYGNMSSPTVLFVLRDIMESGMQDGDWCVILSFGAGLSCHAFLLRK